ncbi:MAG: TolC family protein, partial [Verrucomicrobiales bacterium]
SAPRGASPVAEIDDAWSPESPARVTLSIDEFRRRVAEHNEEIQIQLIGAIIANKNYRAARGAFEPEFVSDYEHIDSRRPNTAEEQASQLGLDVFSERNNRFTNGIEGLLPTNGRMRLGFNAFNLRNNLQTLNPDRESPEYSLFFGANITQPLLRDAGVNAAMAAIRLAARESEIAFQDYRRELMTTLATAESSYWNVFASQQAHRYAAESVELAQSILADTGEAFKAGKASEAAVLAARVGVLEREAVFSNSRQLLHETVNTLLGYYSAHPLESEAEMPITSPPPRPGASVAKIDRDAVYNEAFDSNPDFLRRRKQLEIENIRVAYARNQKRPKLDLKGSYGLNGLGNRFSTSLNDIEGAQFPSWSVGVELRIPLGGNIAGANQLKAAQARKVQALLGLKQLEVELDIALDNAARQIETTLDAFRANRATVSLNERLLQDEREKLTAGRSSIRLVLEVEEDLSASRITVLQDLVRYEAANLQLELVIGSILADRGWEVSLERVNRDTAEIISASSSLTALEEKYQESGTAGSGDSRGSFLSTLFSRDKRSASSEPPAPTDTVRQGDPPGKNLFRPRSTTARGIQGRRTR